LQTLVVNNVRVLGSGLHTPPNFSGNAPPKKSNKFSTVYILRTTESHAKPRDLHPQTLAEVMLKVLTLITL